MHNHRTAHASIWSEEEQFPPSEPVTTSMGIERVTCYPEGAENGSQFDMDLEPGSLVMDNQVVVHTEPKIKREYNSDGDDDMMIVDNRNPSRNENPQPTRNQHSSDSRAGLNRISTRTRSRVKTEHDSDNGSDGDFEPQDLSELSEGEIREPKEPRYRLKTPRKGTGPASALSKRAMGTSKVTGSETEEEVEETIDDLKEDLTILEGDRIKQQRVMKKRPTAADVFKLQNIDSEIQKLKRRVEEMSSGSGSATRAKKSKTAQEYWADKYGKDQRAFKYLNLKKRGKRTAAPKTSPGKNKRLRRDAGDAIRMGEDDKAAAMRVMKTTEPFKVMAMMDPNIPSPGAILLDSRANLSSQMVEIKKLRTSEADPLVRDQKTALKRAASSFGFQKCTLIEGNAENDPAGMRWKLKNFKSSLYNHQVVGASWMVSRELCPQGPHGGILADDMGLGKTVQILACMTANPPVEEDIKAGAVATLIIVPPASLDQWVKEITKHSHFEPFIYNKAASRVASYKLWSRSRLVITTYGEVAAAYPSEAVLKRLAEEYPDDSQWMQEIEKKRGDLFRIFFHRVVLDEAHLIKNRSTQTSRACGELISKYRWAVSGTPIHNRIEEMYPYIRFLGIEPNMSYSDYREMFGNPDDDEHVMKLTTIVEGIMLKREVGETFLGVPIINIPRRTEEINEHIILRPEEERIYRYLETRIREEVNEVLSDKDEAARRKVRFKCFQLTNYLRQISAHSFLGDRLFRFYCSPKDCRAMRELLEKLENEDLGTTKPLKDQLFDYESQLTNQDDKGRSGSLAEELVLCSSCVEEPNDPVEGKCGHVICRSCLNDDNILAAKTGSGNHAKCKSCGMSLAKVRKYQGGFADMCELKDSEPAARTKKNKKDESAVVYGADSNGVVIEPKRENNTVARSDRYHAYSQLPVGRSAKLDVTIEYVKKWLAEAPGDKIIVFTQWTHFGMILGRKLSEEKIGFLYNFGYMSMKQRNKAVEDFAKNPDIKVFIVGFRCGGVALNLACANRVIQVDLWWNKALEEQANSRIYRIGQTKQTHFVRLLTKGTIDERVEKLQQEKSGECGKVMGQGGVMTLQNLSEEQIFSLFGSVEEVDGKLVVRDDYDELVGGHTNTAIRDYNEEEDDSD